MMKSSAPMTKAAAEPRHASVSMAIVTLVLAIGALLSATLAAKAEDRPLIWSAMPEAMLAEADQGTFVPPSEEAASEPIVVSEPTAE